MNKPVEEHAEHQWLLVRGNWGPHRAKYICADCDGAWVKWASIKQDKSRDSVNITCDINKNKKYSKKKQRCT